MTCLLFKKIPSIRAFGRKPYDYDISSDNTKVIQGNAKANLDGQKLLPASWRNITLIKLQSQFVLAQVLESPGFV